MNLDIGLATPNDTSELVLLLNSLFTQESEFFPNDSLQRSGLDQILGNPDIGAILVLKLDDQIVGMVSLLYSISTALGGKVAILEDMVIKQELRGQGLGKRLFNQALNYAQQHGCRRVTLLTDSSNLPAQKFYQSFGLQKSSMIPMRIVF